MCSVLYTVDTHTHNTMLESNNLTQASLPRLYIHTHLLQSTLCAHRTSNIERTERSVVSRIYVFTVYLYLLMVSHFILYYVCFVPSMNITSTLRIGKTYVKYFIWIFFPPFYVSTPIIYWYYWMNILCDAQWINPDSVSIKLRVFFLLNFLGQFYIV